MEKYSGDVIPPLPCQRRAYMSDKEDLYDQPNTQHNDEDSKVDYIIVHIYISRY